MALIFFNKCYVETSSGDSPLEQLCHQGQQGCEVAATGEREVKITYLKNGWNYKCVYVDGMNMLKQTDKQAKKKKKNPSTN